MELFDTYESAQNRCGHATGVAWRDAGAAHRVLRALADSIVASPPGRTPSCHARPGALSRLQNDHFCILQNIDAFFNFGCRLAGGVRGMLDLATGRVLSCFRVISDQKLKDYFPDLKNFIFFCRWPSTVLQ